MPELRFETEQASSRQDVISSPEQESRIGNQTGGRVFLFLYTDDFWRDYSAYTAKGVTFVRQPAEEPYGTVAGVPGSLWQPLGSGPASTCDMTSTHPDRKEKQNGTHRS
ncbi:MAG TPA: hypothetical protein VEL51_18435 [Vicinamibacterales bacterium]|nr:hypothetical protein [Vicinamibacterales bacterium]